jgi:hypothetical protein
MLHHSLAQPGIAKSHPFNLNPYRYDWGDAQTGGLSSPTTKISGGRRPWQPHQDLSPVRFIDLLYCWR